MQNYPKTQQLVSARKEHLRSRHYLEKDASMQTDTEVVPKENFTTGIKATQVCIFLASVLGSKT